MTSLLASENYKRPPIVEAVIEFRFGEGIEARLLEKIARRLAKYYPHKAPTHTINVNVDAATGNSSFEKAEGYKLTSDDQADIAGLDRNKFYVSRLAPYPGWETLMLGAQNVAEAWNDNAPRHPITRLGIRTINRIDVPCPADDPVNANDYLNIYPQVGAVTTSPPINYFMQTTFTIADSQWSATVNTAVAQPPPLLKHCSFILDIDLWRTNGIPLNEKVLWLLLNNARLLKNDLFERSVTDESRKLFR